MKALLRKLENSGLFLENIRFHSNGQTAKGYAIIDADNNEVGTLEPVNVSRYEGRRNYVTTVTRVKCWKVTNRHAHTVRYYRDSRVIAAFEIFISGFTGFKFSALTSGKNCRILSYGISQGVVK